MRVLRRISNDNRGNALVNVIVTLGFIGIIASLVLVVTNNSILMKVVNRDAKKNFYSAEACLDVIEGGLEIDMSVAMINAYYDVLDNYEYYVGQGDVNEVLTDFRKLALRDTTDSFLSRIQDTTSGVSNAISHEHIMSFFENSELKDYVVVKEGLTYEIPTDNTYLKIVGLEVTYVADDYKDTIKADMLIKVPEPDYSIFADDEAKGVFNKYSILAKGNIKADNSGDKATIKGSVWAGDSIIASAGAEFNIECDYLYAGGYLYGDDTGSGRTFSMSESTINNYGGIVAKKQSKINIGSLDASFAVLSAQNMIVENVLNVNKTKCYVRNNLLLNTSDSYANIKGSYFGYGAGTDGNSSSSIIVNEKSNDGKGLYMDLATLAINGTAFVSSMDYDISDSNVIGSSYIGSEILTGDSVAVRGNQVAYMVPVEFTPFSSNPVSLSEYEEEINNPDSAFNVYKQDQIDDGTIDKTNAQYMAGFIGSKILTNTTNEAIKECVANKAFGTNATDYDVVKSVFYRPKYYSSQTEDNGVVYFYLNFKLTKQAANYYAATLSQNAKNDLSNLVKANIDIKADTYSVSGNYITKSGSGDVEISSGSDMGAGAVSIAPYMRYFLTDYEPVNASAYTYTDDNDTTDSHMAIDNVIKIAKIKSAAATAHDEGYVMNASYKIGDVTSKAIIYDNAYGNSTLEITEDFTGILIATGNVKINDAKINGLIVSCNGDIICAGANCELSSDEELVAAMLNRGEYFMAEDGTSDLSDFFGISAEGSITEDSIVSMDGMIVYENWTKE